MMNKEKFSYLKDYKIKMDLVRFYQLIASDKRLATSRVTLDRGKTAYADFSLGSEEGTHLIKLSQGGGTMQEFVHALTAFALKFAFSSVDPLMWACETFNECAGYNLTEATEDEY